MGDPVQHVRGREGTRVCIHHIPRGHIVAELLDLLRHRRNAFSISRLSWLFRQMFRTTTVTFREYHSRDRPHNAKIAPSAVAISPSVIRNFTQPSPTIRCRI